MPAKRDDGSQTPGDEPPAAQAGPKALPQRETGLPGGGQGRVDVTGIVPENIHVDPDITEGHPGYQESGESEIIPDSGNGAGGRVDPE
jgi:hypothetical protein